MHHQKRPKVADLNPHLICVLCGGYYVDATTIIECLHSFCRGCIVRYLETSKYCPICDVQVHKSKPLENIRADRTLQSIVYKMVPGLFHNEMRLRRKFYEEHPDKKPLNAEDAGEISETCPFISLEEAICLSLEYHNSLQDHNSRRFLRCPAAVTITHIQKLIRSKFGLGAEHQVDILHNDDILNQDYSLADVAYIYRWRRKGPLCLTYRIFESPCKRIKLDPVLTATNSEHSRVEVVKTEPSSCTGASITATRGVGKPGSALVECTDKLATSAGSIHDDTDSQEGHEGEKWKEVQIQISENGVMSVTGISAENNSNLAVKDDSSIMEDIRINNNNKEGVKDAAIAHREKRRSVDTLLSEVTKKSEDEKVGLSFPVLEANQKDPAVCAKKINMENVVKNVAERRGSLANANSSLSVVPSKTNTSSSCAKTDSDNTKNVTGTTTSVTDTKRSLDKGHDRFTTGLNSNTVNTPAPADSPVTPSNSSKDLPYSSARSGVLKHNQQNKSSINKECSSKVSGVDVQTKESSNNSSLKRETPRMAVVAPTQNMSSSSGNSKKHANSSPVGYKTLKSPPKGWNQNITRLSFLSAASASKNHAFQGNSQGDGRKTDSPGGPGGGSKSSTGVPTSSTASPSKPPRFFKIRNMPRYLGNPASGVKPMYQVASTASPATTAATMTTTCASTPKGGSLAMMKIDPKTLSPIVCGGTVSATTPSGLVSSTASTPHVSRSSPLYNLSQSPSMSVTSGGQVNSPSNKTLQPSELNNNPVGLVSNRGPVPSPGMLITPNSCFPNLPPNSAHHLLYGTFTGFPGLSNRTGGPPPLVRTNTIPGIPSHLPSPVGLGAYHPLPPSINMLYNPHHRTHTNASVSDRQSPISTPPAVQRIPATNPQHKNNNNNSISGNNNNQSTQKTLASAAPTPHVSCQAKVMPTSVSGDNSVQKTTSKTLVTGGDDTVADNNPQKNSSSSDCSSSSIGAAKTHSFSQKAATSDTNKFMNGEQERKHDKHKPEGNGATSLGPGSQRDHKSGDSSLCRDKNSSASQKNSNVSKSYVNSDTLNKSDRGHPKNACGSQPSSQTEGKQTNSVTSVSRSGSSVTDSESQEARPKVTAAAAAGLEMQINELSKKREVPGLKS